jgi:hypothetical protein
MKRIRQTVEERLHEAFAHFGRDFGIDGKVFEERHVIHQLDVAGR